MSTPPAPEPTALGARVAGAAGFLIAALWIYYPALHGAWLWDDREDLPDNPLWNAPHPLRLIWDGGSTLDYYPLKSSLQWLQWSWWGDHTLPYHLTNVALHVLSALLLWRLYERLGLRSVWAWLGAALFLVHPVAVGSVAWIVEFKDALSLPLLLAAALYYLDFDGWSAISERAGPVRDSDLNSDSAQRARRSRSTSIAALFKALGWFVAAMLAKSSVMMFPAVLLLYGWWARRPWQRVALSTVPFWLISAAGGFIAIQLQSARSMGTDGPGLGGGLFRLSLAGQALGFYFRQAIWPHAMAPVYERWTVGGYGWWVGWIGLAVVLIWQRARWGRAAILGLGWFVLNLIPVLGFAGISFMRFSWVMDHLAYLSLVGVAGLAGAGLQWLATCPRATNHARFQWATGSLGAAAALALAVEARAYVPAYGGEEAIWTYTAEHQPRQWMGWGNLGAVRLNQGRIAEAATLLRRAIEVDPNVPDTHRNLGVVENLSGRPDAAIAEAQLALKLRPDYALAEMDLGGYLALAGKVRESLPYWEAALRLVPTSADLHTRYGYVLLLLNRFDDGLAQLKQSLALDPNWGPAEFDWALLLTQERRPDEALPHFERAARLMPNDANVQQQYALARQRRASH